MENTTLKKKIMRRVYAIWFIRRARPVVFLQLPLMVAFLAISHEYVAFRAIASNTLGSLNSPTSLADYLLTAFAQAEPLVAFLAISAGLFAFLAATSILRNVAAMFSRPVSLPIKIDK